jgi:hypothetical protein
MNRCNNRQRRRAPRWAAALGASLALLAAGCRTTPGEQEQRRRALNAPLPTEEAPLLELVPPGATAVVWLDLATLRGDPRLATVWRSVAEVAAEGSSDDRARLVEQAGTFVAAWYGVDLSRSVRLARGRFEPPLQPAPPAPAGEAKGWVVTPVGPTTLAAADAPLAAQVAARARAESGTRVLDRIRPVSDASGAAARAAFVLDPAHTAWVAMETNRPEISSRVADVARLTAEARLGLGLELDVEVIPVRASAATSVRELVSAVLIALRAAAAPPRQVAGEGSGGAAEGSAAPGTPGSLVASLLDRIEVAAAGDERGATRLSLSLSGAELDTLLRRVTLPGR